MNFFEKHQKILAICGIIAPIIFAIIVIIAGFLRPDYSHLTDFVSELGAVGAPNAIIQRINFVLLGILIVAFTFGLHRGIGEGKGSIIGPLLETGFPFISPTSSRTSSSGRNTFPSEAVISESAPFAPPAGWLSLSSHLTKG